MPFTKNTNDFTHSESWWEDQAAETIRLSRATLFLEGLASCTGITYVNGSLIGDPLDVKMF